MTKNILIYIGGIVTGIVLTFVFLAIIAANRTEESDGIEYFEQPVSYENKKSTSFQVFQVLGNAALADEISNKEYKWFNGKTVMLLNGNFYSKQIVEIENPQQVGTYSYENKGGMPMTVPVIEIK